MMDMNFQFDHMYFFLQILTLYKVPIWPHELPTHFLCWRNLIDKWTNCGTALCHRYHQEFSFWICSIGPQEKGSCSPSLSASGISVLWSLANRRPSCITELFDLEKTPVLGRWWPKIMCHTINVLSQKTSGRVQGLVIYISRPPIKTSDRQSWSHAVFLQALHQFVQIR